MTSIRIWCARAFAGSFVAMALAGVPTACVATPTFKCTTNTQCIAEDGTRGICETTGSCGFVDTGCPATGRRYPDSAGDLASTCVPATPSCVSQISLGISHTCAVRADGAVFCWGNNSLGEIGDGTTTTRAAPTAVVGLPGKATVVRAGEGWSCALLEDQTVWCWGDNSTLELGRCMSPGTKSATPALVMGFSMDQANVITCTGQAFKAKSISLGGKHACALGVDGNVYCWGENSHAQCGFPTATVDDVPGPLLVAKDTLSGTTAVGSGDDYSCARKDDKTVRCWGSNALGSLGDGNGGPKAKDSPLPVEAAGILSAGAGPDDLVLDDETACIRSTDGSLYCWGDASTGIFGPAGAPVVTPTRLLSTAKAFSGGSAKHLCVADVAKNLQCWGSNLKGQTGTGSIDPNHPTVDVPTPAWLISVDQASLGQEHSCALVHGSGLWCWGDNSVGALGIGAVSDTPSPIPVHVSFPCP